jgi:hypothetical protein
MIIVSHERQWFCEGNQSGTLLHRGLSTLMAARSRSSFFIDEDNVIDKRLTARPRYARLRHQAAVEDVDYRASREGYRFEPSTVGQVAPS